MNRKMTHTVHKLSFLTRVASLASCLVFASALPGQSPSWFPLAVGNSWLYRSAPGNRPANFETRSISVHGKESIGSREYFQVEFFGQELLLRTESSDQSVVLYDRGFNAEQPFLSLGGRVGTTFPTRIGECTSQGTIASRDASVTTPAGAFTGAVGASFQGRCADAGLTRAVFAPGVGLAVSEESTFGGPRWFELIYYRVGSSTGSGQETSFTVALDAPRYPAGGTLQARLTLRSSSPDPINLRFTSGQSFDLKIFDAQGRIVYTWSADKLFVMMIRDEKFGPGEKTYALNAPLGNLPPGRYKAQAYLTTDPSMYLGEVSFEIVPRSGVQAAPLARSR